jgi:hypothetical protein
VEKIHIKSLPSVSTSSLSLFNRIEPGSLPSGAIPAIQTLVISGFPFLSSRFLRDAPHGAVRTRKRTDYRATPFFLFEHYQLSFSEWMKRITSIIAKSIKITVLVTFDAFYADIYFSSRINYRADTESVHA